MCECGCTLSDVRYYLPAQGKSFYILTLAGACESCDAPSGFTIELIEPGNTLYDDYLRGDFETELLRFNKWPDSVGRAFITGMTKHQFVKALTKHLVGVDLGAMSDGSGRIDEIGAETILEEMYPDACVKPKLVERNDDAND